MRRILTITTVILMTCIIISCKKETPKQIQTQTQTKVDSSTISNTKNDDLNIVKDIEGTSYKVIKIGTQTWFTSNLRTKRYNDSSLISNVNDSIKWNKLTIGAYCLYKGNNNFDTIYGKLYNWYSVNTNKLCPFGWHVPTDNDWTILTEYLGSSPGDKMKEVGNKHWKLGNSSATNSSGFNGLPGGQRMYSGSYSVYDGLQTEGYFWSSTSSNDNIYSIGRELLWSQGWCEKINSSKNNGMSVRCLKD